MVASASPMIVARMAIPFLFGRACFYRDFIGAVGEVSVMVGFRRSRADVPVGMRGLRDCSACPRATEHAREGRPEGHHTPRDDLRLTLKRNGCFGDSLPMVRGGPYSHVAFAVRQ